MRLNLKLFRVKHRLSQSEFAQMLGVGRAMYGHIERGIRNGSAEFWSRLQAVFEISEKEIERLKKIER